MKIYGILIIIFVFSILSLAEIAYSYTWHIQNTTDVLLKVKINASGQTKIRELKPRETKKAAYKKWYNKGLCLTDVHFKRESKGIWKRAKHADEELVSALSAVPVVGQVAASGIAGVEKQNLCKSGYIILFEYDDGTIRYYLSNKAHQESHVSTYAMP